MSKISNKYSLTNINFNNVFDGKKIVLYDNTKNANQYYGIGLETDTLKFQLSSTTDNFVFKTATNSTTSVNIMKINGTGSVEFYGDILLNEGYNSTPANPTLTIKKPTISGGAFTLTLPSNKGNANEIIKSDGTGVLSFDTIANILNSNTTNLSLQTSVAITGTKSLTIGDSDHTSSTAVLTINGAVSIGRLNQANDTIKLNNDVTIGDTSAAKTLTHIGFVNLGRNTASPNYTINLYGTTNVGSLSAPKTLTVNGKIVSTGYSRSIVSYTTNATISDTTGLVRITASSNVTFTLASSSLGSMIEFFTLTTTGHTVTTNSGTILIYAQGSTTGNTSVTLTQPNCFYRFIYVNTNVWVMY